MSLVRKTTCMCILARHARSRTHSSFNAHIVTGHRPQTTFAALSSFCHMNGNMLLNGQEMNLPIIQSSRFYSKKAKKDKGGKKSKSGKPKVELSSEELNSVINDARFVGQLEHAIVELKQNFAQQLSVRTTRASFEQLTVVTEDGKFPLIQLAQITQKTPQLLIVNMASSPQYVTSIKEAVENSGLNVNPQQEGTTLYIPIPKVTREHRESLAKSAKSLCDKTKEKLRDIHNRYSREVKKQQGEHSDDLLHAVNEYIQHTTRTFSDQAESLMAAKQKDLLS